ncbi:MAG: fatty acid desaturase [Sandaracinaceae bacterium]|nr:fatty acid desaturase [Sandaracinaceae bacterium]
MNELRRVEHPDPHRARTRELLRAHPEIKGLLGPTGWTPPLAVALVLGHLGVAAAVSLAPWWVAPIAAFVIGALLSQALYAVLHECTHQLAGRGRTLNRVVSLVANLPLLAPIAISYAHFHLMHHRHQGDPARDPDLPAPRERALASAGPLGKLAWHATFPVWQLLRTGGMPTPKARGWLALNGVVQVAFVAALAWSLGPSAILYLALSLYFTMAMHPIAARLFQEHHVVAEGQETYSYYGWLNALSLNIGYHVEHHDFPAVAWHRLPALRRLAKERYDGELVSHASWARLWLRFFTDARLGPLARIVRGDPAGRSTSAESAAPNDRLASSVPLR